MCSFRLCGSIVVYPIIYRLIPSPFWFFQSFTRSSVSLLNSQWHTIISNYWMRPSRIWRILQIKEGVIHRGRRPRWITPSEICRILHILRKPTSIIALLFIQKTQPCPQVFSVNSSIICGGLHFWCHFDVIGSIILDTLHFWRHWFNMVKMLSKFGEQHLVMVNSACGFNQSETGKYFEWIIIDIIINNLLDVSISSFSDCL